MHQRRRSGGPHACKGTLGGVRAGVANFYADAAITTGTAAYPTLIQLTDGSFQKIPFGAPDGITYGLVVADWNGDGSPEIATANSDGQNCLYQWSRR